MTYASINFRTKKAFREAVEAGREIRRAEADTSLIDGWEDEFAAE